MTHALAVGLSVIAAGNLVLFSHQEAPAVLTAVTVMGFGLGLALVAANSLGTHVPEGHKATSAGILSTSAQLGTATGIAVILLVASAAFLLPRLGRGRRRRRSAGRRACPRSAVPDLGLLTVDVHAGHRRWAVPCRRLALRRGRSGHPGSQCRRNGLGGRGGLLERFAADADHR